MRSITLSAYSRNKYDCSDVMVTIRNRNRINWPFEWRFISESSRERLLNLMESYVPIVRVSVYPLEDNWYCSNQDQTVIQFMVSEDNHD